MPTWSAAMLSARAWIPTRRWSRASARAISGWLGSALFAERVGESAARAKAEVPILLNLAGSILRGSIDLLVEDGDTPLVVDYKTDRLGGTAPGEHIGGYEVQRSIYALAVADARQARRVEVAYVFLERPEEPVIELFDSEQMDGPAAGPGRGRRSDRSRRVRRTGRATRLGALPGLPGAGCPLLGP